MIEDTNSAHVSQPARRLERDPNGSLGGVASGMAYYFGIDVAVMRIILIASTLTVGFGPIFYLLAWLVVPVASAPLHPPTGLPGTGPLSGSMAV